VVQKPLHPLHAVLLAGTVPLFLAVALCDLAYGETYEIQWKNFSSWLLVGALFFAGFTLLWAVVDTIRDSARTTQQLIYMSLLLVLWVLGFINALVHAGDAAASMSAALVISTIVALLTIAATWLGFARSRRELVS
jgi:uncharacterized membrane protein